MDALCRDKAKSRAGGSRRGDGSRVRVAAAQAVQAQGQERGGLRAPLCRRHARRVVKVGGYQGGSAGVSNQREVSQADPAVVSQPGVGCATRTGSTVERPWLNQMIFALLCMLLATWIARIIRRPSSAQRSKARRHAKREAQSVSTQASDMRHHRAKPAAVREVLFTIALEAPDASCRMIADRFNRDHVEQGWSVGKTYVSEFLRDFRQWRASPKRHLHSIDTAGAVNQVWAIDLTEHRIEPRTRQPLLGILDHGSRRMLTLDALRERTSIAILRLLLDAIEHYGKPKAIRTDNEAMFTS